MREYETTFIVQPEISDEAAKELLTRIDGILERSGAVRLLHDDQGKRRLAYDIQKFQKGRYVTSYYLSDGSAVTVMERALRLEESVLRFLTVMADPAVIDIEARKATRGGKEVHLTPIEFRIIACLAKHLGMVVTHRQLLSEVWGPTHLADTHYLRIYMKQLRDKLEIDPVRPRHFVTETGVGYRLVADDETT